MPTRWPDVDLTARSSLQDWLAHCERIHPVGIELGLDRVEAVRARLGLRFEVPVITVGGTNGKGSTCAMLESILRHSGWRVGVYTSPHLVHFEERCRIDGLTVEPQTLLPHFEAVEAAREGVSLTYFEFTTLVILRALSTSGVDAVALEVGLGGRLDAVNVIDADVAIVTSVDLDHMDYLGADREAIGREKAGIFRTGRPAIVGDPVPPSSLIAHAEAIGADLRCFGRDFRFQLGEAAGPGPAVQWSWIGRQRRWHGLAPPALRGQNQLLNASGVLAGLEALHDRLPVTAQGVRVGLALVELPGRFQVVPGQPTLVLDVAHNPHAVAALAANLDPMGYFPRTLAVFGAMADKDLAGMLAHLVPYIDTWHCCDLPTPRAATAVQLSDAAEAAVVVARQQGRSLPVATSFHRHASPSAALAAALAEADPADRILVFGSFFTVGGILADGLPRTAAAHV